MTYQKYFKSEISYNQIMELIIKSRFIFLISVFHFNMVITYSQNNDQEIINNINYSCNRIDSNSSLLAEFNYDHQFSKLFIEKDYSLTKAYIGASEMEFSYDKTIYLDPNCKNISFVLELASSPDEKNNELIKEKETWFYFKDKKLIKKIQKTRTILPNDSEPKWDTKITQPNSQEEYEKFLNDLSWIINHTIIRKEAYYCDD